MRIVILKHVLQQFHLLQYSNTADGAVAIHA